MSYSRTNPVLVSLLALLGLAMFLNFGTSAVFSVSGTANGVVDMLLFWSFVIVVALVCLVGFFPGVVRWEPVMRDIIAWTRTQLDPAQAALLSNWQVLKVTMSMIRALEQKVVDANLAVRESVLLMQESIGTLRAAVPTSFTMEQARDAVIKFIARITADLRKANADLASLHTAVGTVVGTTPVDTVAALQALEDHRLSHGSHGSQLSLLHTGIGSIAGTTPADTPAAMRELATLELLFQSNADNLKMLFPTEWEPLFDTPAGRRAMQIKLMPLIAVRVSQHDQAIVERNHALVERDFHKELAEKYLQLLTDAKINVLEVEAAQQKAHEAHQANLNTLLEAQGKTLSTAVDQLGIEKTALRKMVKTNTDSLMADVGRGNVTLETQVVLLEQATGELARIADHGLLETAATLERWKGIKQVSDALVEAKINAPARKGTVADPNARIPAERQGRFDRNNNRNNRPPHNRGGDQAQTPPQPQA